MSKKKKPKSFMDRMAVEQAADRKRKNGTIGNAGGGFVLNKLPKNKMIEKLRELGYEADAAKLEAGGELPKRTPATQMKPDEPDTRGNSVYGIFEGDHCRYVGQTTIRLARRLRFHKEKAAAGATTKVAVWLRHCSATGIEPEIRPLVRNAIWNLDEIRMIKQMTEYGHQLLNMTPGGDFEHVMSENKVEERLQKYGLKKEEVALKYMKS